MLPLVTLIDANVAAEAGPARASIGGDAGRLCALWSEELATTVHLWPVGFAMDASFEATTPWTTGMALGGTLEWPPLEYARTAGGWLIRLERPPGEYGHDFIPD